MTDKKIPLVPENWQEHKLYLPPNIINAQKFMQSRVNNYDNIFQNCFGKTQIKSSDIDGFYHLGNRNTPRNDYSKDIIVYIESKWGLGIEHQPQLDGYKSTTYDKRKVCLLLYFDEDDIFQNDPIAYTKIYGGEVKEDRKQYDDKNKLKKELQDYMKKLSKYVGIL
jgi:hypothetical protein